jgi:hypothetical protein
MRWEHVDLAAGTILLPNTKAGRQQTVAINAPARQVLLALRPNETQVNPWVLPNRSRTVVAAILKSEGQGSDGRRQQLSDGTLKKDAMEAAWQKIRAVAGLEDVHLHDLRHTVGTYAGQSGANAFLVRDLLRHSDLSMTHRYVNKSDDRVRTLNDLVGERIAANLEERKAGDVVPISTRTHKPWTPGPNPFLGPTGRSQHVCGCRSHWRQRSARHDQPLGRNRSKVLRYHRDRRREPSKSGAFDPIRMVTW